MLEWIVENTVMAALLAAIVAVVTRFNRSRPALCHLLWCLVLVVLVMPRLPLPNMPGRGLRQSVHRLLWSPADAPWSAEAMLLGERAAELAVKAGEPGAPRSLTSGPSLDAALGGRDSAPALATTPSGAVTVATLPFWSRGAVRGWAHTLWIAGAIVLFALSLLRIARFQRLVRRSQPAPVALKRAVATVARRLGVKAPETRLLEGVGSPSVWCFGRPQLLWPADVEVEQHSVPQAALIAHELAHLTRRDHWMSWLEVPAATFLWWNPLFWLVRGRIRHLAELSSDAWAVWAYPADRRAFAEALIDMHARTVSAPIVLQGLGATDSEFKDFEWRLQMIMKTRVSRGVSKGAAALALLATATVLPAFSDEASAKRAAVEEQVAPAADSRRARIATLVEGRTWHKKGEELFQAGELEAALEAFERAVALDPDDGPSHARMGYILVGLGRTKAAMMHFRHQYEVGHKRPTALYNMGCTTALAGGAELAIEHIAAAVRQGFTDDKLMAEDADLASLRDDTRFQELIARARTSKELRKELAAAGKAGDASERLAWHAELVEIVADDGELQSDHGHLALKAGDFARAEQAFGRQAELGYNVPTAYYNRACARARSGDAKGAMGDLERSVEEGMSYASVTTDTDLDTLRGLARFEELQERIVAPAKTQKKVAWALESGDVATAMPELKRLLGSETASKKQRAWAATELGQCLVTMERYDDALAVLDKAATMGVAVDQTAFQMAHAYAGLGRDEDALAHVEHALALGYADPEAVSTLLEARPLCSPQAAVQLVERASVAAAKKEEKSRYGEKKAWSPPGAAKAAGYAKKRTP